MNKDNIRQLRMNVEEIICRYIDARNDYGYSYYPDLTKSRWIEYCTPAIYDMKVINGSTTRYKDGICNHLRFLGYDTIREVIVEVASEYGLVK